MARIARVVAVDYPHHVTQRGNRRQRTFFNQSDYQHYFDLLVGAKHNASVEVWAYCFMPNHVHLIVVPRLKDSLSQFFGEAHRRYTLFINQREGWKGHLWQERFHSFVMDEEYLRAAVRYTELNPVRAGLCHSALDWKWSSALAHIQRQDDGLVSVKPMLDRIADWQSYLGTIEQEEVVDAIRVHSRTGRPSGDNEFVSALESLMERPLKRRKPGPPKASELS